MRNIVEKYTSNDLIDSYNHSVQNIVMPSIDIAPFLHILDCTKIQVNLDNINYENSEVIKDDGEVIPGYKIGTL